MAENTKIAGYSAEAVAKEDVNPVYEIKFGICTAGRKKADSPESITTVVVKDAESLSISIVEAWKNGSQWIRADGPDD